MTMHCPNPSAVTVNVHSETFPQLTESCALAAVRRARFYLFAAISSLDDAGYECPALDELHSDAAALLAEWGGRCRPPTPEPEWMQRAAIEWRADRDRRNYRRPG